jgi:hypothetical protein
MRQMEALAMLEEQHAQLVSKQAALEKLVTCR